MNEPPAGTSNQPPQPKQRHWCLTAYLVFMVLANSLVFLYCLMLARNIRQNSSGAPVWILAVVTFGTILNIVCSIALLRWKKWGFWGCACAAGVAFFGTLYRGGNPLLGLLGLGILYCVLHIGKERKGWTQLE